MFLNCSNIEGTYDTVKKETASSFSSLDLFLLDFKLLNKVEVKDFLKNKP